MFTLLHAKLFVELFTLNFANLSQKSCYSSSLFIKVLSLSASYT